MSDEAAFLAALKANPADDTARLVYADWLNDHDEPQKAQYLRAVADLTRLPGGSDDYTDAAVRLYAACARTYPDWRRIAGARFDVVLEGFADKIRAIITIRERAGFGLAEAKAMAESAPTALFSWLPFEAALPHLLAFVPNIPHGVRASIRATVWPEGERPGAVFDVLLCELHSNPRDWRNSAIDYVAQLLHIERSEAHERLQHLPLLLGSGLHPTAVADFVRRLKLAFNVGRALPPGAIRIVPRLPS